MILACSQCSVSMSLFIWLFLPIALWIFKKIRKNHPCPCDCHEHENIEKSS